VDIGVGGPENKITVGEGELMRIRSLRPEFWKGKKVRKMSPWARLLLLGLNNYCDDEGRGEWDEVIIKAEIFPEDKINVAKLLNELVETGAIVKYQVDGCLYLAIPNWGELQHPNHPQASKLPPFTERSLNVNVTLPERSLLKSRVGEGKVKDSRVGEATPTPTTEKVPFGEGGLVRLTIPEYDKLVAKYGELATGQMIEKLANHKGAGGKRYKSDYRAILKWVVEWWQEKGVKLAAAKTDSPPDKYDGIARKGGGP